MRGFTLVELIMVIVIIGILAVVVGPRFFDRKVFDERLYFEQSLNAVRFAQKLALSSGCPVNARVGQPQDQRRYVLSYAGACAGGPLPVSDELPSGVRIEQALNVTFNSLGAATADGCGRQALPPCATRFGNGFGFVVHLETGFIEVLP